MKRDSGFTLVELVVVILILGILAGVAAPKFFSQSAEATDNGLKQTLSVIRDAIELYAAENNGALPPTPGTDGSTSANFHTALQPYIRGTFPSCPVGDTQHKNNLITATSDAMPSGDSGLNTGWIFSTNDGSFICSFNGATANEDDGATTYDEL